MSLIKVSWYVSRVKNMYASWVTFRPLALGSMRQGEAEIHRLQYWARETQAAYSISRFSVHYLLRVGPKQLCALSHLGCKYPRSGYFLVSHKMNPQQKFSELLIRFFAWSISPVYHEANKVHSTYKAKKSALIDRYCKSMYFLVKWWATIDPLAKKA